MFDKERYDFLTCSCYFDCSFCLVLQGYLAQVLSFEYELSVIAIDASSHHGSITDARAKRIEKYYAAKIRKSGYGINLFKVLVHCLSVFSFSHVYAHSHTLPCSPLCSLQRASTLFWCSLNLFSYWVPLQLSWKTNCFWHTTILSSMIVLLSFRLAQSDLVWQDRTGKNREPDYYLKSTM